MNFHIQYILLNKPPIRKIFGDKRPNLHITYMGKTAFKCLFVIK